MEVTVTKVSRTLWKSLGLLRCPPDILVSWCLPAFTSFTEIDIPKGWVVAGKWHRQTQKEAGDIKGPGDPGEFNLGTNVL